jgi:SAM-dependent methyltransferase
MRPAKPKSAGREADIHTYLERALCPLCGGEGGKIMLEAQDAGNPQGLARGLKFKVRQCQGCGAYFTSPRFREDSKHIPFLGKRPVAAGAKRPGRAITRREMRPYLHGTARLQLAHPSPGTVLDLAMGDGVFLHLMRARGWSVCGLEKDRDLVAYVRARRGIAECAAADVEYDALPAGPFDAVILWGLLPRLYRPQALLVKVREVLAPGGVVGISVPNFRSMGARLFRKHWGGLGVPRHLLHFDAGSLRRLVENSGFQVLDLSFNTPSWIVGDSVRSALPLPRPLGSIARGLASILLGAFGGTSRGDIITLIARA